jgi:hypothetical protein
MGSGKTTWAIQKMNEDKENNYIYITPFLDEVKRIKEQCSDKKFYEPLQRGKGKLDNFHTLLADNKNIASTHALFQMSTDITRELIKANNYILILDEVFDVIEQTPLKKNDMEAILEHAHINEECFLIWNNLEYDGRYNDIKTMALNKSLIYVNNTLLMWNFPVNVFNAFKECYIMTYLFDAQIQKYYYDLHNIDYEYYTLKNRQLVPYNDYVIDKFLIKKNINILLNDVINKIGDNEFALSVSWYKRATNNKELITKLKKNLYNYFQNKVKAKNKEIIWTTFKDYEKYLKGKGYFNNFIACNERATNKYREKTKLAYCVNIFLNPIIKQFFIDKGVNVLEDKYALSELLQWLWRSAIRDDKPVNIYIPSSRMRYLLIEWLDNKI